MNNPIQASGAAFDRLEAALGKSIAVGAFRLWALQIFVEAYSALP
jgi:hypothetical protein